jgi:hypothetical protein
VELNPQSQQNQSGYQPLIPVDFHPPTLLWCLPALRPGLFFPARKPANRNL